MKPKDELIFGMLEALIIAGTSMDNLKILRESHKVYNFDIFAVSSLTSLAATIAVIPSTVSRCGLNS